MSSSTISHPRSVVSIAGHSIHSILMAFPFVCFTLALVTDVIYWQTAYLMWLEFSTWLLFAGMVLGGIAVLFGVIDLLASSAIRSQRMIWPYTLGVVVVLTLAFFNNLVHTADGWTAVMPYGLTLSALTVIAIIVTAWLGASLGHVQPVGARRYD